MTSVLKSVSGLALVVTIGAPLLYFLGGTDLGSMKAWMSLAALAWFAATPFWLKTA